MLTEGRRVTVTSTIDLSPLTLLNVGETGTVVRAGVEPFLDAYVVEVRMDQHHAGLNEWGNRALLVYPDIAHISVHSRKRLLISDVAHRVAATMAAAGVWGYALVTRALL